MFMAKTCVFSELLLWETWPGASVHSSVVEVGLAAETAHQLPLKRNHPQHLAKKAGAGKLVTYYENLLHVYIYVWYNYL